MARKDGEDENDIKKLEEMELWKLFNLLFFDKEFITTIKREIAKKTHFTKDDIMKEINIPENSLWDRMIGHNMVRSLKRKFETVRTARNAVMHAHNKNFKWYSKTRALFIGINKELEEAILDLMSPSKREQVIKNIEKTSGELSRAIVNENEQQEFVPTSEDGHLEGLPQLFSYLKAMNLLTPSIIDYRLTKLNINEAFEEFFTALGNINANERLEIVTKALKNPELFELLQSNTTAPHKVKKREQ